MDQDRPHIIKRISVLLLEDNPADAKLILHALQAAGFEVAGEVARTQEEFKQLLNAKERDIVIADFFVPGWTGLDAIRYVKSLNLTTPVILATGSLGDEQAVECLKQGASDYVLKDKLHRLPIAVTHALQEHQLRVDRDRAERELRQSEQQYRLLFNSNPQPMWVYDLETLRFLAVNETAIYHYGYSKDEFLSLTIKDIRPAEEVPKLMASVAGGRDRQELKNEGTWKHRKKDGTIIYVNITEGKLNFLGRPAALICVEDVTEQRVLEQQFLQAQKMEAVGRLAGGVAHDFNNLLMIISSSAQLIQDNLERRNVIERYTLQIRDASEKAASLTRQLLAFSRKQVLQLVVLDLNVIVAELCKMLPRLLGEDISVDLALAGDLGRILADRGQIEQVVMNLGVNARDAMPTGGKLTIETRNVDLDQEYIGAHGVKGTPGKYVMLSITDSGVGMSDEVKAKIFEPFFTTKEIGKGTGLGLATVYGIVKQSNGWIWVYSEPGKGSTFKVYLPRTAETGAPEQKASLAESASGTETILIVEDEAALRQVTSDFLEAKGYHVLQANDGPSALVLIAESSNDINLLITDMVMPGFGGAQLAREFLSRRPNGSVIFVSGYSERATSDDLTGSQKAFLQKPFSLNSLARTMRSLLDHRPADSGQSS